MRAARRRHKESIRTRAAAAARCSAPLEGVRGTAAAVQRSGEAAAEEQLHHAALSEAMAARGVRSSRVDLAAAPRAQAFTGSKVDSAGPLRVLTLAAVASCCSMLVADLAWQRV